jgi:hypothetical protein
MGPSAARLLASSGPFSALPAFSASAGQRTRALPPAQALAVLAELTRHARSGERGTLERLLGLLPAGPSLLDLRRRPYHALLARIEQALERKQLLFVPGWDWLRTGALAPARAEAAAPSAAGESRPRARPNAERPHELRFEYVTNTGHFITDDDGFELRGPGGAVQKGKLANGRLQRTGVEPGVYELRTRAIRRARWSSPSASPFESVQLIVTTGGFPDGTQLELVIRPAHGPRDASGFRLQAALQSDQARATWAYEQALGARCTECFQFEVRAGRKHARSDLLAVNASPAGTPRGTQERLRARGYDPGPAADDWTAELHSAVQRFQTDHPPLVACGELDPFTADLLDDPFA